MRSAELTTRVVFLDIDLSLLEYKDALIRKEVLEQTNAFEGMTTINARQPDTSSTAWSDSVEQALASSRLSNPIGKCLWFVTNTYFASKVIKSGTTEYWNFGAGNKKIIEKKVLGDHTFYRVEGY